MGRSFRGRKNKAVPIAESPHHLSPEDGPAGISPGEIMGGIVLKSGRVGQEVQNSGTVGSGVESQVAVGLDGALRTCHVFTVRSSPPLFHQY